jgi:hypothetical protein
VKNLDKLHKTTIIYEKESSGQKGTSVGIDRLDVNSVFKLSWQHGPAAVWIEGQPEKVVAA